MATENPAFDHLLHWVPDVPAAASRYTGAGYPAQYTDPADGFQNGAWRLDTRYVEILSTLDERAYGSEVFGEALSILRPEIEEVARRGGGALTFAVNVTDAAASAERLRSAGHHVEELVSSPTGYDVRFHEVLLRGTPAWAPFLITYDPPREEIFRRFAGGDLPHGGPELRAVVARTDDPERSASWLGTLLDVPVQGVRTLLPGGEVHFEEGPEERITALVTTGKHVEIDGLELRTEL